jgi:predicted glycogen debranching enzyme
MDRDGLVALPAEAAALTWMDARVEGEPVTPRAGKPVEIQALWYNALEFLAELDLKLKEKSRGYEKLAAIARASFNEKFWNERERYLFDRLEGREKDPSIRPNALLAVSLPYEILDASRFRDVVDRAERDLLTPAGLRTLAPSDPAYRGRHRGPPAERDRAYHQGSVWPWLLGPFCTAFAKAHGSSEATKTRLAEALIGFRRRVTEEALGSVYEVMDGDEPHAATGCPFQAWSVAEILRVLWEENIPL